MATDQPYDFVRSRSSRRAQQQMGQQMSSEGRQPSLGYDRGGRPFIRGFRSRPGAPQAANDPLYNLTGMRKETDGFTNSEDWGKFFKGNSPEGVRMGYGAANPAIAQASDPTNSISSTDFREVGGGILGADQPTAPSLLTDPLGFGSLQTDSAPAYLGSVINNAQEFFRRRKDSLLDA